MTEATFRNQLGKCFAASGNSEDAIAEFTKASETRNRLLGPNHRDTIEANLSIAAEQFRRYDYKESLPMAQQCFDRATKSLGVDDPLTLEAETLVLRITDENRPSSAMIEKFEDLVERTEKACGRNHAAYVEATVGRGLVLHVNQQFKQAAEVLHEAREASESYWGVDHRRTMEISIFYWNSVVADIGAVSAKEHLETQLNSITEKFGPHHEFTLKIKSIFAGILFRTGRIEQGEDAFNNLIDSGKEFYGKDHPLTFEAQTSLAYFLVLNNSQPRKARRLLQDALPHAQKTYGETSSRFLNAQTLLARSWLMDQSVKSSKRLDEALAISGRFAPIAEKEHGFENQVTFALYEVRALALGESNKLDQAISLLNRLVDASRKNSKNTMKTAEMLAFLAVGYGRKGDLNLSIEKFEGALAIHIEHDRLHHRNCHEMLFRFYQTLSANNDFLKLERYARMGRGSILPEMKNSRRYFLRANEMLVEALEAQGKHKEAELEKSLDFKAAG